MTVTYGTASLLRLLFKWKGSLWKSVWIELIVFLACFIAVNLTYRFALGEVHQKEFEGVVHFTNSWIAYIPIQFILGFFVSFVIDRWWAQLESIPYPDKFLLFMTTHISGNDKERKLIRRTIGRWVLLHCVLVWREISKKIKKRFPTNDHLLKSGLVTQEEYQLYSKLTPTYGIWWVPMNWVAGRLQACSAQGMFNEEVLQSLLEEMYEIRNKNEKLTIYDWINVPLRYIQVATFATYGYFFLCLIGRQTVTQTFERTDIDLYIPVVTIIEFIFYVGWLKVAEVSRIPFGDDEDDFDMNYILDRHFQVTQLIVDDVAAQNPKIVEDLYWNQPRTAQLPHTKASFLVRDHIPKWRLDGLKLTKKDIELEDVPFYSHKNPPLHKGDTEMGIVNRHRLMARSEAHAMTHGVQNGLNHTAASAKLQNPSTLNNGHHITGSKSTNAGVNKRTGNKSAPSDGHRVRQPSSSDHSTKIPNLPHASVNSKSTKTYNPKIDPKPLHKY